MTGTRVVAYLFGFTGVFNIAWGLNEIYTPLATIFVGLILLYISNFLFTDIQQEKQREARKEQLEMIREIRDQTEEAEE